MGKKLWEASDKLKNNSNLLRFEKFLSNRFNKKFNKNYEKIQVIFGKVFGIIQK
jgi:hypothetical protein